MEFLSCLPIVFVIGRNYEILVNTKKNGICAIEIGGRRYYEENSGVLSSEKSYAKIRLPQRVLDAAKAYTVIYRETIHRKAYNSEMGDEQEATFSFKPIQKTDGINIYHVADVHYGYELALSTSDYFGDELDLLVVNGDIGEVESELSYLNICTFVGKVSRGAVPVVFTRGNHDTRGRLAERFCDIFPSQNKNLYYTFELGRLRGIVLDCGEDKNDDHPEYAGVNLFSEYRRRQTRFLRGLRKKDDKLTFAVSHVCPVQTTLKPGDPFDIERDVYSRWNTELHRLGVSFMLCGHIHRAYILPKNSEKSTLPHDYPVIVGSARFKGGVDLWGAAITVSGDDLSVKFTNSEKKVKKEYILDLQTGEVTEINTEQEA